MLNEKLERFRGILRNCGSCLVAYSGGVDSALLAFVAHEVLGTKSLAVIADTPSLPRRELEDALDLGKQFGFRVRTVKTAEFEDPKYLANPQSRCYFCKQALFSALSLIAETEKFAAIAYGENASDSPEDRPGSIAAREFHVLTPLKEAGLSKGEIRALSAYFGLPTAEKPQLACLSSRIPHGQQVTAEKLRMIEAAEAVLRGLGFVDVRVRHHEWCETPHSLRELASRPLARIEVNMAQVERMFVGSTAGQISAALRQIGYSFVTVDLEGYHPQRGGARRISLRALQ